MQFDLMTGNLTWARSAELAKSLETAGFSGMLFTEAGSVPWMQISSAAQVASKLDFSTGIAVTIGMECHPISIGIDHGNKPHVGIP